MQRYREIVDLHLAPAIGAIPLGTLQPANIQSYYSQALASGHRDGSGRLSPQTVVHHNRVLNRAMKRARALRLIPGNPVEDVSKPKVDRPEIEILKPTDAARLLATARSTRMYPIIVLGFGTGLGAAKSVYAGRMSDWSGAR
jgi:integrase